MKLWVLDSGVMLKAVLPEEGTGEAMALLEAAAAGRIRIAAPEFGLLEFANVLWKAERRGYLPAARVEEALAGLPDWRIHWASAAPLLDRSVFFARTTGQGVYDGVYLALAESLGAAFVTADARLLAACAGKVGFATPLSEAAERAGG